MFAQKEAEQHLSLLINSQKQILVGNPDSAVVLLKKCIDENSKSDAANYSLSRLYQEKREYDLAIFYGQNAMNIDGNNLWYIRNLLNLYEINSNFSLANELYLRLLEKSDEVFDYDNACRFFYENSDYKNELLVVVKAIAKFPDQISFYKRAVRTSYILNNFENVEHYSKLLISNFYQNAENYEFCIDYLLLSNLTDASQNVLKQSDIYLSQGENSFLYTIYYTHQKNTDSSYFYLEKYLNSYYADADKVLPFLEKNKDFWNKHYFGEKINDLYSIIIKKYPNDFEVVNFLANSYFYQNSFYTAIELYEKSTSLNHNDFDSYINLLNLYSRFSMFSKLDSLSEKCLELFPAQPYVYIFKSIASLHLGNYDAADEALVLGSTMVFDQSVLSAYFSFYKSQYFRLIGDESKADQQLKEALSFASSDCNLLVYFAFYFSKFDVNPRKSLKIISPCITNDTSISQSVAYLYSYILYKNNDFVQAKDYINIAIENSEYPNFLYFELLGNICAKSDEKEQADEAWEKSVKLGNIKLDKTL